MLGYSRRAFGLHWAHRFLHSPNNLIVRVIRIAAKVLQQPLLKGIFLLLGQSAVPHLAVPEEL